MDFTLINLERLRKVEALAEEVLRHQNELLQLDRKRNKNREALGAFRRKEVPGERCWSLMSKTFVRLPCSAAQRKLQLEKVALDTKVDETRPKVKKAILTLHKANPDVAQLNPEVVDLLCREREGIKAPKTLVSDDMPALASHAQKTIKNKLDYSRFEHIGSSSEDDSSDDDFDFGCDEENCGHDHH